MGELAKKVDEAGYVLFHEWRKQIEENYGVAFFSKTSEVPSPADGEHRLAVISARTSDNPVLFAGCIDMGCQTIFLEKPGAPTVSELEKMRDAATEAGCMLSDGA